MRFHPNRRASTDHAPGPMNAKATPMVPNRTLTHGSPDRESAFPSSAITVRTPSMGVHKPASNNNPTATANTCVMADSTDSPSPNLATARPINPIAVTSRIRRRPAPGQPRAKVENNLRKSPSDRGKSLKDLGGQAKTPKESAAHSFEY